MSIVERTQRLLDNCDIDMKAEGFLLNIAIGAVAFSLGASIILHGVLGYPQLISALAGMALFIVFLAIFYGILAIRALKRAEALEAVLPDFLSLMSSNLRSGLTPDRAFIMSVRSEFGPLEKEIDMAAKEIVSGKSFTAAFRDMAKRTESEIFAKSVRLIIEGVRSGGNLAELLENTALDIRRFSAVRKEISAIVRVYELFIIAAATVGAPLLYGVASFLIDVISDIKDKMNLDEAMAATASYMPIFGGTADAVSPEVVFQFSIAALVVTSFFGALTAGVISKGRESSGYIYVPLMITIALAIFFLTKFALETFLKGVFIF
jgi:archaellum biogenesis protein FlaJ (TadC family)